MVTMLNQPRTKVLGLINGSESHMTHNSSGTSLILPKIAILIIRDCGEFIWVLNANFIGYTTVGSQSLSGKGIT